ncbi:MAG: PorP/SprF family type IX secretion system membrane protein [Bacteroidales bacterium]
MRLIHNIYSIILILIFSGVSFAQDVSFSQPYSTPLLLNPAIMGVSQDMVINVGYSSQWAGIDDGYKTARLSAHSPVMWNERGKLDLGLFYYYDRSGAFTTHDVGLAAGYTLLLDDFNSLSLSLGTGYRNSTIDYSAMTFGDQYIAGRFGDFNETGEVLHNDVSSIIDATYGVFWHTKPVVDSIQFFAGISGFHFYDPVFNFMNQSEAELDSRTNFIMGLKSQTIHAISVSPQFMSSWQGGSRTNFVGLYLDYAVSVSESSAQLQDKSDTESASDKLQISIGSWYSVEGKTASFILGLRYDAYALGYSYGFGQSMLKEGPFNMGRNEISLSYFLNRTGKQTSSPLGMF